MAAQLSLAAANVTDEQGALVGQRDDPVLIRGNVLRIGAGKGAVVREHVMAVESVSRGVWSVRFPDATVLTVARSNAACCGQRR